MNAKEIAKGWVKSENPRSRFYILAQAYLDLLAKREETYNRAGPDGEDGSWAEGWNERCGMVLVPEDEFSKILDIAEKGNMLNPYDMATRLRAMIAKAKEKP